MQEWLNSQTALHRIQLHSEQAAKFKIQLQGIQENMKEQKSFWSTFEQTCETEFYLRDLLSLVQLINSHISELKFKLQKKLKDFDNKQFIVPKFNEKPMYLQGHNIHVYSVDVSADSNFFISGTINGVVGLWNLRTMQLLKQLKDQKGALFSVAYSGDQRYIASGSSDNIILLWDLGNIYDKTVDYRHDGFVRSIKFTSDSSYLVSGSDDGSVRIWGVKEKTKDNVCIHKMEGHTSHVYGVSVSHDMKYISSIGNDNQIIIWNFQDGEQIIHWIAHENGGCCVEYSRDSTLLVSCGYDCLIKLWNPINGEMIRSLVGHSKMIWSVTFSEDSMFIASASRDGTVRTWNILNGQQLQCLHIVGGDIGFPMVRFSNDMKCLLATGNENNIRLYRRE